MIMELPLALGPAAPDRQAEVAWPPQLCYIPAMQRAILIVVVVLAVAVIGWALWPSGQEAPPPPEPAPTETPAPEPPPRALEPEPEQQPAEPSQAAEPEVVLPPLEQSDPFVRERLEPLDLPEPWVEQGDYVRRLAVLAENASRGEYPRRQLSFLAPQGEFKVERRNDRIFVDPVSYDRYDPYVRELEEVDPARVADLLETLDPLVEQALGEIGVEAPPGQVFQQAVQEALAVPMLEGEGRVELVQPNVMYEYANPELESLSPLQKQILRMGPDNVRRLQDYLRRVAQEMELDVGG